MKIELDKDKLPINAGNRAGGVSKYPFHKLDLGESFLVKVDGSVLKRISRAVASSAYLYKKNHGGNFTMRTTAEGIRVWRTK